MKGTVTEAYIDSDVARLWRWFLLVIANLLTVVGLVLLPLVPGLRKRDVSEYAFRIAPLLAGVALMFAAAWLRRQEALDATNEGKISTSLFRHLLVYVAVSVVLSVVIFAVLQ